MAAYNDDDGERESFVVVGGWDIFAVGVQLDERIGCVFGVNFVYHFLLLVMG